MNDTTIEKPTANKALATQSDKLPAYIKESQGIGRGNENVGSEVVIPRIKLLQKMSDEVDKHHSSYVKGASDGDFYNTVTKENYGDTLYAITVMFNHEFIVWRKREKGGGFGGTFSNRVDAENCLAEQEVPAEYDVVESHSHLLLVKNPKTGLLESTPAIMDFSGSKLRVSKAWNSEIGLRGGDRFAGLWKLKSETATNKQGQSWMVLGTTFEGWAQEEDYKAAEALYDSSKGVMPV